MTPEASEPSIANLRSELDLALMAALPSTSEFGVAQVIEAMNYSLGTPGKRLRPLLFLSTCCLFGIDTKPVMSFAVGIEMIHAYSLVHDDLPAMDDDKLRRGKPTNHVVYGEGMAVLAGDGLLTEAFASMLAASVADQAAHLAALRRVAHAAGWNGMVGGQAADLAAEGRATNQKAEGRAISEDQVAAIHSRKTGALFEASVMSAADIAGASERDARQLLQFSREFGVAFQVADDIKDETMSTEQSGKEGGGDRARGKATYVAVLGVDGAKRACREKLTASLGALDGFGSDARSLRDLAASALDAVIE